MQPTVPSEARVFHTLDALRGIAAIGVVMFHFGPAFLPIAVPGGYLAVDLFFMMSGVVLSHAYEHRFRRGMGAVEFMRLRVIRLYPLYLVGLALGITVTVASMYGNNSMGWDVSSLVPAIVLAAFFLPVVSGQPVDTLFPLNIPSWSLFLELGVNLLFVLLWPLTTPRRLLLVIAAAGLIVAGGTYHLGDVDQGSDVSTLAIGIARTVFGFGVGVLIARHIDPDRRTTSNPAVFLIMAAVIVAVAASPGGAARIVWDLAAVLVIFPLVVYWGTRFDPGARLRKVATFLGVTSYGLYVIHSPLSAALSSATRHFGPDSSVSSGSSALGLLSLGILIAGAWTLDRFYDAPVRRFLGRLIPKPRSIRPEA